MTRTLVRYILVPLFAVFFVLAVFVEARGSTDEREAVDDVAAAIVSEAAMEDLAAILADPVVTPACKGYADLLLHLAGLLQHMLEFPESRISLSEFSTRVAPSVPAAQYACENAI